MKTFLEILLLIIAVVVLIYLSFHFAGILLSPTSQQNLQNQVCFKGEASEACFSVELAKTEAERDKGLMNRTELGKNKGMLFIFDKEGVYPFWMKNTLIPLDMIWIKESPSAGASTELSRMSSGQVVFISQDVQPCKSLVCPIINPSAKAKYVLEINAGISGKTGIKLGDEVKINIVN